MGGGEYDSGRDDGAQHYSEAEGSWGAGNRGVSVEQDRHVAMIKILNRSEASQLAGMRGRRDRGYEEAVRPIIEAVRQEGETALLRYARELDGLGDLPLRVTEDELGAAAQALCGKVRTAAETAIRNIRQFAEAQLPHERFDEFSPGRKLGWIVRPLEAVGCCIPSGRYPLPSTLLMTAVLAQAAGVPRISVTSPHPSLEILACAHMLGIGEVYRVGGAQA